MLTALLDEAVQRGDVPFAVGMVADHDGVVWQGAAGDAGAGRAAGPDTVVQLWSLTKAVGALMAMIAVERGLLTLDTPVVAVLGEFAEIKVLQGIGPDGPVLREPSRPVTLRHLLTHTSGLAYDTWDARQAAYQAATGGERIGTGRKSSWFQPLMFDPGEAFTYGIGAEWAALMVSVADGRAIERFCHEEILAPLGMADTAFEPDGRRARLARLKARDRDGGFTDHPLAPPPHPEAYGMGSALYGTTADYVRLLRLVLRRGELDGVRLIGSETAELLFANQIGAVSVPRMPSNLPVISADMDWFPETRKTWTAGFMRVEGDVEGRRRAGSLSWAGLVNTHYWIDPASGITAAFVTQLLPLCDRRCMAVFEAFERAVYREFGRP
jgi:methyl acetate hydrolase